MYGFFELSSRESTAYFFPFLTRNFPKTPSNDNIIVPPVNIITFLHLLPRPYPSKSVDSGCMSAAVMKPEAVTETPRDAVKMPKMKVACPFSRSCSSMSMMSLSSMDWDWASALSFSSTSDANRGRSTAKPPAVQPYTSANPKSAAKVRENGQIRSAARPPPPVHIAKGIHIDWR